MTQKAQKTEFHAAGIYAHDIPAPGAVYQRRHAMIIATSGDDLDAQLARYALPVEGASVPMYADVVSAQFDLDNGTRIIALIEYWVKRGAV
jgi:hypothetical protein